MYNNEKVWGNKKLMQLIIEESARKFINLFLKWEKIDKFLIKKNLLYRKIWLQQNTWKK